jgi:hypothetical protein
MWQVNQDVRAEVANNGSKVDWEWMSEGRGRGAAGIFLAVISRSLAVNFASNVR